MGRITEKQRAVLDGIIDFKSRYDYSPTIRELCEITGFKSTSTIAAHLRILRDQGYITWIESMPRTIQVIGL